MGDDWRVGARRSGALFRGWRPGDVGCAGQRATQEAGRLHGSGLRALSVRRATPGGCACKQVLAPRVQRRRSRRRAARCFVGWATGGWVGRQNSRHATVAGCIGGLAGEQAPTGARAGRVVGQSTSCVAGACVNRPIKWSRVNAGECLDWPAQVATARTTEQGSCILVHTAGEEAASPAARDGQGARGHRGYLPGWAQTGASTQKPKP